MTHVRISHIQFKFPVSVPFVFVCVFFFFLSQQVRFVVPSVSFDFGCCGNDYIFTAKVPEGRHVERHVREANQVLKEDKQNIDSRFTELVLSEEVCSCQTTVDVKQEETQLPML